MRLVLLLVCSVFLLTSTPALADRVDLSEFIDPNAQAQAKPRDVVTREPASKKVATAKRGKTSKAKKTRGKARTKHARAKRRR